MKAKILIIVKRIIAFLAALLMKIRQLLSLRRSQKARHIMLKDLLPILEAWGVKVEGQSVYEFTLNAEVNDAVRVTIKSFARVDTGELKKICEQYELVKK